MGLVLLTAFLSASFQARNSDVWLHMATGRLIASAEYRFGSDPFAYTTADRYWANHSWLFDLGLFQSFRWFGDAAVGAFKAAIVAIIAACMLLIARGSISWLNSVCVLLGVLALSSRVLLQPVVLSYLFLALTLLCLKAGGRAFYVIPALIALWVNIDAWFLMGPLMVILFWAGCQLNPDERDWRWPRWLIPASLLACLLSPHHFHALSLPLEISPEFSSSPFLADPRIAALLDSPWHWRPLGTAGGYNLSAWALFALLVLGAVSFALNRRAIRSWRGTTWLALALMAAWKARLIPFFAVAGAPICALNLGELLAATQRVRLGRTIAILVGVALAVIAFHGRGNGFYNRDRGVAWGIHTDRTLEHAAESIARWQEKHPDEKVFANHIELGHYLAWFSPGTQYFFDSRLQLFSHVAYGYQAISSSLDQSPRVDKMALSEKLKPWHISGIEFYDADFKRMTDALERLRDWELVRIDGGAVFLKPKGTAPGLNAERLAFSPSKLDEFPPAGNGPLALAEPAPFWATSGRQGSWEADAATIHLHFFEEQLNKSTPPQASFLSELLTSKKGQSPAWLLLAVRASRVGIEKDAADAAAWLRLARAYQLLAQETWERHEGKALTPLERIRRIQITTALVQAIRLNPDSVPARELLAKMFYQEKMFDLAFLHAREHLRLVQRAGSFPGESHEAYRNRIAVSQGFVNRLEAEVLDAENRFLIRTASLAGDPLARARIAAELRLVQKGIDVLIGSHFDLYGYAGVGLLIDLLLQTGQAGEARVLLDRDELRRNTDVLGIYNVPARPRAEGHRSSYRLWAYDWLDLCQNAAVGNYDGAAGSLKRLDERLARDEQIATPALNRTLSQQVAGDVGFSLARNSIALKIAPASNCVRLQEILEQIQMLTVWRADLATLAGMLELERGHSAAALESGEKALALFAERPRALGTAEPLARRYVEAIRREGRLRKGQTAITSK